MRIAVLAFSGGLDTSYCAVWLHEQGYEVHTVTVQTGGFDAAELAFIEQRAQACRAACHTAIDAREELFDDYLKYLIFGNVLRGDVYPLCVSAERVVQARRVADYARLIGAAAVVHGSTGAGNDQFRFDAAFRVFARGIPIMTPIREQALSRESSTAYLAARGVAIPASTRTYSVNRGMWGATIGGGPTHRSDAELPESAYLLTPPREQWPAQPETTVIEFERGVPTRIDGEAESPVAIIGRLNERAGRHGVGRGMHVGDTILGIKGRVAFEAPAATVLIAAHRELEKLVLSRQQQTWKRLLGDVYGGLLHEARFFDPVARDVEAFLESSQQRVTGTVSVRLHGGRAMIIGADSPCSLMNLRGATYGEGSGLWTGAEAAAFSKLYTLQDELLAAIGEGEGGGDASLD